MKVIDIKDLNIPELPPIEDSYQYEIGLFYMDKDNNVVNENDIDFKNKAISVELYLVGVHNKTERNNISLPDFYLSNDNPQFNDEKTAFSYIKQSFSGVFKDSSLTKGDLPIITRISIKNVFYNDFGFSVIPFEFMKNVFAKFKDITIFSEIKVDIPLENFQVEKLKSFHVRNAKLILTGINRLDSEIVKLENCEILSRYKNDESEVISQFSVTTTYDVNVINFNILNDCRIVFAGKKESQKQYMLSNANFINIGVHFEEENQYSKNSDSLLAIKNYNKVVLDNFIYRGKKSFHRLRPLFFDTITNLTISDYINRTRNSEKTSPEIFLSAIAKTFISDCIIISDKLSESQAFTFNKLDEFSEINIMDCVFTNINAVRMLDNKIDMLNISDINTKCTNFIEFKGMSSIVKTFIKSCNIECENIEFPSERFESVGLSVKDSNIRVKNDFKMVNYNISISNCNIKANNIYFESSPNLIEPEKQKILIDDCMLESTNIVSFTDISPKKTGTMKAIKTRILTKDLTDKDFNTSIYDLSKIEAINMNFNSVHYRFSDLGIDLKRTRMKESVLFKGLCDGELSFDFRNSKSFSYDLIFDPETNDNKRHDITMNFIGNAGKTQEFNLSLNQGNNNIMCKCMDTNTSVKINININKTDVIDNSCHVFSPQDAQILFILGNVIDSRTKDCVYTTEGKTEKGKFNYGKK